MTSLILSMWEYGESRSNNNNNNGNYWSCFVCKSYGGSQSYGVAPLLWVGRMGQL